jgi:hypothetical protein
VERRQREKSSRSNDFGVHPRDHRFGYRVPGDVRTLVRRRERCKEHFVKSSETDPRAIPRPVRTCISANFTILLQWASHATVRCTATAPPLFFAFPLGFPFRPAKETGWTPVVSPRTQSKRYCSSVRLSTYLPSYRPPTLNPPAVTATAFRGRAPDPQRKTLVSFYSWRFRSKWSFSFLTCVTLNRTVKCFLLGSATNSN